MTERKPAVSFSAFEVEQVEWHGGYLYELVPLTKARIKELTKLEAEAERKSEQARLAEIAAESEAQEGDEVPPSLTPDEIEVKIDAALDEVVELYAQALDIRTKPLGGGRKSLGDRFRSDIANGAVGVDQALRFCKAVSDISPFGE